jgi:hypothetical protein
MIMTSTDPGKIEGLGELSKELRGLVRKMSEELRKYASVELVCKIDADCPPGYVCEFGKCVKKIA